MPGYFAHRTYPLPKNEAARLDTMRRFEFLVDPRSPVEHRPGLDRLCELACDFLQVDRAFVSLVFEEEQRFVGRANSALESTPRRMAFCAHTIAGGDPLVVPDTRDDERFADHPAVIEPAGVRFYAGIPLAFGGHAVGTFCVAHSEPRSLSAREQRLLAQLSAVALDYLATLIELEDRSQQGALLQQSERLAKMGGWEIDVEARTVLWSKGLYRLVGLDDEQPIPYEHLAKHYPNGAADRLTEALARATTTGEGFTLDLAYATSGGQTRAGRMLAEVIPRVGHLPRILGTLRDVSEEIAGEEKWRNASYFDAVTGLPTRSRLLARLADVLAESGQGALLVVGLDYFAAVNQMRGRDEGDAVLRGVAERLREHVATEPRTFLARLDGDRFGLVVQGARTDDALIDYADGVLRALAGFFRTSTLAVGPGASIGLASYPADARDAEALVRAATNALSSAKDAGRGRAGYASRNVRALIEERRGKQDEIRRAVVSGEIALHFEPVCDLRGVARGLEARLRWQHPQKGLIAPEQLGPQADAPEAARTLADFTLRQAIVHLRRWLAEGNDVGFVVVPLAASQPLRSGLAKHIAALLENNALPAHRLLIEVPAAAALQAGGEGDLVRKTLAELSALGVGLGLSGVDDDLERLPQLAEVGVDRLKLLRAVAARVETNTGDQARVHGFVHAAARLGLSVAAEGVDNAARLATYKRCGIGFVLGKHLSRVLPAEEAALFARLQSEVTRIGAPWRRQGSLPD